MNYFPYSGSLEDIDERIAKQNRDNPEYRSFTDVENSVDSILDENADIKEEYRLLFYSFFARDYEKRHKEPPYSINEIEIIREFEEWLKKQALLTEAYAKCLSRLNYAPRKLPSEGSSYIELYKGDYDTLKKAFHEHITVYSNYATTIDPIKAKDYSLSNNDMHVIRKVPVIKRDIAGKTVYLPFSPFKVNMVYVHNPYSKVEENRIRSLLQNDDLNVVYGIFGLTTDPELEYKLNQLDELFNELLSHNQRTNKFFSDIVNDRKDIGDYKIGLIYKPRKIKETD